MASKKGIDLDGADQVNAALGPMVGLVKEDLFNAFGMVLRKSVENKDRLSDHLKAFAGELAEIASQKSDLAPDPKDKRFKDPSWESNPFFKMGLQYYLAANKGVRGWIDSLEMEDLDATRARFISSMVMDALSPTNSLLSNPTALKKAIDTGGLSLVRGLQNAYDDLVNNDAIVSQVDKRPFKIGENIANSEGAVVYRTEMLELIQYKALADDVHSIPLMVIPPQINKSYINDLTPDKSMIRQLASHGIQVFMVVWRNPQPEHGSWGMSAYIDETIKAMNVIQDITGSKKLNIDGACSGGITTAVLLSRLKADGDNRVNCVTLKVCVLKSDQHDSEIGSFLSDHGIELARQRSAKKGVLDAASLSRTFTWLRPNDLVWNYVVNNYLLGEDPPAFDILFWNNDAINLSAGLHSDYLDVTLKQPFVNHGEIEMAGHKIDISKVDADIFMLAGVTDHITPWKACYRSTQLFGSKNIEFILSHSGHIQAMLNPPGNPKAKYYRAKGAPPATADAWLKIAEEQAGSWWPLWTEWLTSRSGQKVQSPKKLGNQKHKPIMPAPGEYMLG